MKPGDKVGRYELGEQIGEGAMAQVFASRHPLLERNIAIKILKKEVCSDSYYVDRFLDDARAAHGLNHPNVVRVLDVDDSFEQPFIVMDLVEGKALDRWLDGRQVGIDKAIQIARDVASALSVAHSAGMVHRDVKPQNILIEDSTGLAKLTDFGAAKRERPGGQQLTQMGQRIGTPRYMAPEQVDGSAVDTRTDLFALGATLYEMLAGRPVFEGETVSTVFHGILFREPPDLRELRAEVPDDLQALVRRLLAKSPDERPASANEVVAELDRIRAEVGLAPVAATAAGDGGTERGAGERVDQTMVGGAPSAPNRTDAGRPPTPPPAPAGSAGAPAATSMPADDGGSITNNESASGGYMKRSRLVPLAVGAALLLLIVVGALWLWPGEEQVAEDAPPPPGEQEPPEAVEPPLAAAPEEASPPTEPETPVAEAEPPAPAEAEPEAEAAAEPTGPDPEELAGQAADLAEAASGRWPEGDQPGQTLEPVPPAGESPAAADVATAQPEDTSTAPADTAQAQDLGCADGETACTLAQEVLNAVPPSPDGAPEILLNKPDGVYLDQEYLVVEVAMPSDLGGYLYLDVLTEAGEVFHLLPEPLREDNRLDAGAMIRVGVEEDERAAGVRHWQVSAPFGPGYLLATVSEEPLYDGLRPVGESLEAYRTVLMDGLNGGADGGQAAQVVPIEFRPN